MFRTCTAVLLATLTAASAHAEITLRDAVDHANARNPESRGLEARMDEARAEWVGRTIAMHAWIGFNP